MKRLKERKKERKYDLLPKTGTLQIELRNVGIRL